MKLTALFLLIFPKLPAQQQLVFFLPVAQPREQVTMVISWEGMTSWLEKLGMGHPRAAEILLSQS